MKTVPCLILALLLGVTTAQELHPDIVKVINVTGGVTPGGLSWADSYSVGDSCYCASTFDHNIGPFYVETPLGWMTVLQVCDLLGPGPGIEGRPVYNDVQCGNGPPNDAGDEHVCPGRTDVGQAGCGQIGPRWNFTPHLNEPKIIQNVTDAHPDIRAILNVTGGVTPNGLSWADSYSDGDSCYCASSFDHNIGPFYVETPLGWMTVLEVCEMLGPGPGIEGKPVYNDVQCGNGPPNDAGDEHICPGRTDRGEEGCGQIGPKWNFAPFLTETSSPSTEEDETSVPTISPPMDLSETTSPTMEDSGAPSYSIMHTTSSMPSDEASNNPTMEESDVPSGSPSVSPSVKPTLNPTVDREPNASSSGVAIHNDLWALVVISLIVVVS